MAQSPQMNRGIVKQVIQTSLVLFNPPNFLKVVNSLSNATFYIEKPRSDIQIHYRTVYNQQ